MIVGAINSMIQANTHQLELLHWDLVISMILLKSKEFFILVYRSHHHQIDIICSLILIVKLVVLNGKKDLDLVTVVKK
jgi:hypothetical protein